MFNTIEIVVACCFLILGIAVYTAVYIEMKKAQKIWGEKRR